MTATEKLNLSSRKPPPIPSVVAPPIPSVAPRIPSIDLFKKMQKAGKPREEIIKAMIGANVNPNLVFFDYTPPTVVPTKSPQKTIVSKQDLAEGAKKLKNKQTNPSTPPAKNSPITPQVLAQTIASLKPTQRNVNKTTNTPTVNVSNNSPITPQLLSQTLASLTPTQTNVHKTTNTPTVNVSTNSIGSIFTNSTLIRRAALTEGGKDDDDDDSDWSN